MAETTEQKLVLTAPEGEKIARVRIADDSKSVEIILAKESIQELHPDEEYRMDLDKMFPIINPEELSTHELMNHIPETDNQDILKENILEALEEKLRAFRAPIMDPRVEGRKLIYKPGEDLGGNPWQSCSWWDVRASAFEPTKNSRIGTNLHWAIFLGNLMMYLVDKEKYSVREAWAAVCDDSSQLCDYKNNQKSVAERKNGQVHKISPSGSRPVGPYCDLTTTRKILRLWDVSSVLLKTESIWKYRGDEVPLAAPPDSIYNVETVVHDAVPWVIMDV